MKPSALLVSLESLFTSRSTPKLSCAFGFQRLWAYTRELLTGWKTLCDSFMISWGTPGAETRPVCCRAFSSVRLRAFRVRKTCVMMTRLTLGLRAEKMKSTHVPKHGVSSACSFSRTELSGQVCHLCWLRSSFRARPEVRRLKLPHHFAVALNHCY